jgi:serine/threonine protein kinase
VTNVGGWTLVRKLASGGMGTVWKVTKPTGMRMPIVGAMKIPLAHVVASERESRRFVDEAHMLMCLDHPNIVRVLDAGLDQSVPYMVMQWVNGTDLLNLRKGVHASGSKFSVAAALFVTGRVLAALDHAHTRVLAGQRLGIIHRDVKPANVLISSDGHVMLTDFGVASMIGDEATGNAHGTPRYMSPEQFRGRSTHQSDLWGAGAVLWEMLATAPFRGELSSQQVLDSLVSETAVVPPPRRSDFPLEMLQLLQMKLLAVPTAERFPNAAMALNAIESCEGFDVRAANELRDWVRRLRPQETSGFTELMQAIPDSPNLEIDVIYSAASGRSAPPPSIAAVGMDPEDAPTDRRTPPELPVIDPSNPTMMTTERPPTEVLPKTPHPAPEPDAPTVLRRPRRQNKAEPALSPAPREDPPDIAGVIHTPVLVPRPAGTVPPADTDRLPLANASNAAGPTTEVLPPELLASILTTLPKISETPRPEAQKPWVPSWKTRRQPTDPSIPFEPFVGVAPLLEPYQKRILIGLLAATVLLSIVAIMLLRS